MARKMFSMNLMKNLASLSAFTRISITLSKFLSERKKLEATLLGNSKT